MKKEWHVAHPEAIQAKPDLTNFDFSGASLFRSKASLHSHIMLNSYKQTRLLLDLGVGKK